MSVPPPPPAPEDVGRTTPARSRRGRGWIVVLVSVLAVIFVVLGIGTALFVSNTLPPYSAAHDFIEDIVDGDLGSAGNRLCRAHDDSPETAIAEVLQNFGGGRSVSVNPFTVDREGDRATVEYGIRPRDGGEDRVYELPMRKEGGDWVACPGAGG